MPAKAPSTDDAIGTHMPPSQPRFTAARARAHRSARLLTEIVADRCGVRDEGRQMIGEARILVQRFGECEWARASPVAWADEATLASLGL